MKRKQLTYHVYPLEVAIEYGMPIAAFLQNFAFWYALNVKRGDNFFEGDHWVRMKMETLKEYFPFMTLRQLRHTVDKMVELNLLKKAEFNQYKNNHTKWYSLTPVAKKLMFEDQAEPVLELEDSKENPPKNSSDKNVCQSDKNVNSIYKEVDIERRYIYILEKLQANAYLIEVLSMQNKVSKEIVDHQIKAFAVFCQSVAQPIHNNDKDLFTHFGAWFNKQDLAEFTYDKELNWFMQKFNSVSKREFVATAKTKELFSSQINNGFTGRQMLKAIENLYSSNVKNVFHLKHDFKFATPEYLLKEGNLNKYLNLKY